MKIEVDQSVRIEELNRDTIIGVGSKTFRCAFRLPRKTKRYFNKHFRRLGKAKRCAPTLFTAAIILALKECGHKVTKVVIDVEYIGYEILIQSGVARFFPKAIIVLNRIGKLSPAHQAAYGAHLGRRKIHGTLNQQELLKIVSSLNKKAGWRTPSPGMNRDSKVHNQPNKRKITKKPRHVKRPRLQ